MPDSPLPIDHAAEALRLEREAADLRGRLSLIEAAARLHRALAGVVESALTKRPKDDTVNAVNATELSPNALRSRSRAKYQDNRFVQAMATKEPKGETISDVARILTEHFKPRRFHQNTVQGWYVPVGRRSHRDCPIEVREFLRDHYGKFTSGEHKGAWRVPLDSWPLERGR